MAAAVTAMLVSFAEGCGSVKSPYTGVCPAPGTMAAFMMTFLSVGTEICV
jgi:hypothetical protein